MPQMPIHALILDFGGVISLPQDKDHVNNMLEIIGQTGDNFETVYRLYRGEYDLGRIDGEEYWRRICNHYGVEAEESRLRLLIHEDVASWVNLNRDMLKYIEEIRPRLRKMALLSNMTPETLVLLKRDFDFLKRFDACCYSCEIGLSKPKPEIYLYCLDALDVRPEECLFVDDTPANVEGARKCGIHAIHFRTFQEFQGEVEKLYRFRR